MANVSARYRVGVTYEVVTEESCEAGDAAERGWLDAAGFCCAERSCWSVRELFEAGLQGCESEPAGWPVDANDPPSWVTFMASDDDLWLPGGGVWGFAQEGEAIGASVSVHRPEGMTNASWCRLCRLLGVRGF